jgi:ribose transport system substrate-binding protein
MRGVWAAIGLIGIFTLASCDRSSSSGGSSSQIQIAVIPKGTTHVFWKSVEAGAERAGKELGVKIVWKGPLKENDRAEQI